MKKKNKRKNDPFFEGYSLVETGDTVTFGTSVWTKDEGFGVIIVFPAGQMMKYAPLDDITPDVDKIEREETEEKGRRKEQEGIRENLEIIL